MIWPRHVPSRTSTCGLSITFRPSACISSIARRTTSSSLLLSGFGAIVFEDFASMYQVAIRPAQRAPVAASARRESLPAG